MAEAVQEDGESQSDPRQHRAHQPCFADQERCESEAPDREETEVTVEDEQRATEARGDAVEGAALAGVALDEHQEQEQLERRKRPHDPVVGPEVGLELNRDRAERPGDDTYRSHPPVHPEPAAHRPHGDEADPGLHLVQERDREGQRREVRQEREGMEDQRVAARLRAAESDGWVPERVAREDVSCLAEGRADRHEQSLVIRWQENPVRDQDHGPEDHEPGDRQPSGRERGQARSCQGVCDRMDHVTTVGGIPVCALPESV